jgi:hypothetical protein
MYSFPEYREFLHAFTMNRQRCNLPLLCLGAILDILLYGISVRSHIKCKTNVKMLGWIFNKCGGKLNSANFGRETVKTE